MQEIHLIPDKTAFVQLATFILVILGLSFFVFRPLKKIILMRKSQRDSFLDRAAAFESKIKKMTTEHERKMEEVRAAAHKEKEEIRRIGLDEEARVKAEARRDVAIILEKARAEISDMKEKTLEGLKRDIPSLAEDILKRIL